MQRNIMIKQYLLLDIAMLTLMCATDWGQLVFPNMKHFQPMNDFWTVLVLISKKHLGQL